MLAYFYQWNDILIDWFVCFLIFLTHQYFFCAIMNFNEILIPLWINLCILWSMGNLFELKFNKTFFFFNYMLDQNICQWTKKCSSYNSAFIKGCQTLRLAQAFFFNNYIIWLFLYSGRLMFVCFFKFKLVRIYFINVRLFF